MRPFRYFFRFYGQKRRKRRYLYAFLIISAVSLLFLRWFDLSLRPQLISLTENQIRRQFTLIADASVAQALSDGGDHSIFQEHMAGDTVTMSVDTRALNLLRTTVLDRVICQVESLDSRSLGVPVGALTGFDLLSALGPPLPIQVLSVASARGEYRSTFAAAGINQTLHRIMLDITVDVRLLLPGGVEDFQLTTPVCVSETIIIGQVPQSYLEWGGGGVG